MQDGPVQERITAAGVRVQASGEGSQKARNTAQSCHQTVEEQG